MVNTPGPGGYLLAWGVSVLAFAGFLAWSPWFGMSGPDTDLASIVRLALAVSPWVAFFSVPFALPGIVLVHLACRTIPHQAVHVAAAGLAGYVAAVWIHPMLGLMLAPATAFGRLCVVPLVEARRRDSQPCLVRC